MYVQLCMCQIQYFIVVAPKQSYPYFHNLEDQQGHPQQLAYNLEDQSIDDATGQQHCEAVYKVWQIACLVYHYLILM